MKKNVFWLRGVKAWNAILITIPFALTWMLYYADRIANPYYEKGNYLIIALFLIVYVCYGRTYDAFLVSIVKVEEMVYSQTLAFLMADGVMYVVCLLLTRRLPEFWPMVICFGSQILLSVLWCSCARNWYYRRYSAKKSVVVYDMREDLERTLSEHDLNQKFKIEKTVSASKCAAHLSELPEDTEVVFFSGVHSHERNIIMKYCIAHNIQTYVIPRIGDMLMQSAHPIHMMHLPILQVRPYGPGPEYLFIKRLIDIVLSLLALIIASPIMIVTAIAIKATDGGPVFYRQRRLTQGGRTFEVLKFRSMRVDAEKDGVARLSSGDKDDRITPVGHVIRKTRIDELPQLLNILKGDMSIVGPRPERPEIAEQYYETLPEFALRLQAKAGLTGYAQVYGKYNTTPYDKLLLDLSYISHPGILEDLRIMFATVKILFMSESTEGVEEGQMTAMENVEEVIEK